MFPDFARARIGVAKVMSEVPLSDGTTALEIRGFRMDETGVLDSTFRLMPLIPNQWRGSAQPAAFQRGVLAMCFARFHGEVPELLFLTAGTSANGGVWRFAPSRRAVGGTDPGLEQIRYYYKDGVDVADVYPQERVQFPPQMVAVGNRIYFTFCDGAGAWVYDGRRVRPFGYSTVPSAPQANGPARLDASSPNNAGFAVRGRVGTTEGDWTNSDGQAVGGLDDFERRYAVVFENTDGAYSATSAPGGVVSMRRHLADESGNESGWIENLTRRFSLTSIPRGPPGSATAARILLATANLKRLPEGDFGRWHWLFRMPSNEGIEWIDDIPDGELGPVWEDRTVTPSFYFLLMHGGSMFMLRTDGHPARVWWSEQGPNGPIPESILATHWSDVFPATGPLVGGLSTRMAGTEPSPLLLLFKEGATHYFAGRYPEWEIGTLHDSAGCAGPSLAQVAPDGASIWYGSRTFWRLSPEGKVDDVGGPLRRRLRRVNHARAHMGVSWVDRRAGEVCFALPMDDSATNDETFVWDYRLGGWRIRRDVTVDAACVIGGSDLTLLAGTYGGTTTVYAYGRGYPGWAVTAPTWVYTTGWSTFASDNFPTPHNANDAIFTLEERAEGTATCKLYRDWNLDSAGDAPSIHLAHPENDNIAYWASATDPAVYGTDVYRTRRTYVERIAINAESHQVFALSMSSTAPVGLVAIDAYGPAVALPGGRTPQAAE